MRVPRGVARIEHLGWTVLDGPFWSAPGRREDRAPHGGHPRRASFGHEGALVDEHQLFEHTVV